jgi:uncharacterized protein
MSLPALDPHLPQIEAICRRHGVKLLQAFGSAVTDAFDPERSDVDLFVEFASYDSPRLADDWFELQEELESMLGRKVDLVVPSAVRNPKFLRHASRNAVTLYAA